MWGICRVTLKSRLKFNFTYNEEIINYFFNLFLYLYIFHNELLNIKYLFLKNLKNVQSNCQRMRPRKNY